MANILDSLINRIEDSALRTALASEVDRLRNSKEFGLVFERHIPESVRLHTYPIKRGIKVQDRSVPKGPVLIVTKVENGIATLVDEKGSELDRPVQELVAIREFGEPVYPGLRTVGRLERGGDKTFHTVLNAENYHALEVLAYAYENKVDVIKFYHLTELKQKPCLTFRNLIES